MREAYLNYCYSKGFLSVLIKCGLIRRKVVRSEMTTIIQKKQWMSFILEHELINVKINKSKVNVFVENKLLRRDVLFIRIGNNNYPSYVKSFQQYNSSHLPPVTYTYHVWRMFLQSITIDISYSTYWNDCINSDRLKRCDVQD